MTTITREMLKDLRADLNTMLKEVGAKHGLALSIGNIRYDSKTLGTKIEGVLIDQSVTITTEMVQLQNAGARILGVEPAAFNKSYRSLRLGMVKFVGYSPRSTKYPFIVQTQSGAQYKLSKEVSQIMIRRG